MTQPPRRVLCAEPNEDICHLVSTLLGQQGHQVTSVRTVSECLAAARSGRFDLYMLDDRYLDGTALELCRLLRVLSPATPILFFSTQGLESDRERAAAAGATRYLVKPDDIFEVVQTVTSILATRAAGAGSGACD